MGRGAGPASFTPVTEIPVEYGIPAVEREDWRDRFPDLVQGVTTRGAPEDPFDLRLRGATPGGEVLSRWDRLREALGVDQVVQAHQPHEATVRFHRGGSTGFFLAPPGDGHLTGDRGVLLAVTVADCVPVFLAAPEKGAVALLHAGWRGVAAGILEEGVAALRARFGVEVAELHLHLGPSISRSNYEVSPEVFRALGLSPPSGPERLDLRGHLAERALRLGVHPHRIGISTRCTLDDPRFFSHRGGDEGRQVAYLGWRSR